MGSGSLFDNESAGISSDLNACLCWCTVDEVVRGRCEGISYMFTIPFISGKKCMSRLNWTFWLCIIYFVYLIYRLVYFVIVHMFSLFFFIPMISLQKVISGHRLTLSYILRFDILLFQAWPMVPTNLVTWAVLCHSSKTKILAINPALPRVGVVVTVMRVLALWCFFLDLCFSIIIIFQFIIKWRRLGVETAEHVVWFGAVGPHVVWLGSGWVFSVLLGCLNTGSA